jgi:hypothetical protein
MMFYMFNRHYTTIIHDNGTQEHKKGPNIEDLSCFQYHEVRVVSWALSPSLSLMTMYTDLADVQEGRSHLDRGRDRPVQGHPRLE